MLSKDLHDAGARHRSARAPDTPDAAWFASQAAQLERILRLQYEDGTLHPRDEAELARHDPAEITGAIRRFAFLKHLYYRRSEDLVRREEGIDIQEVARQLLTAEPVRLELAGTVVEVTDRSYSAMFAIASHWMAIQMLDLDLERADDLLRRLHSARNDLPRLVVPSDVLRATRIGDWSALREAGSTAMSALRARRHLHRRIHRVGRIYRRVLVEREAHRQAIYAHAFTDDGAPATSLEEAPAWWRRIDPREDAVLVATFLEVGHGRYERLGEPPERKDKDEKRDGEDFGWHSLFASIERQQRVPPATAYDRRLFQQLTWLRAGAPPAPTELED